MQELANIAKPCFEDILRKQRKQALDTINRATSDIQSQYDEALSKRSKQITVATAATFLNPLKFQDDADPKNVRGLKNGILVCNRDTGFPLHVLPNQNLLFKGNTTRYFPKNTYQEDKTESDW